jgi:hypothetical protein
VALVVFLDVRPPLDQMVDVDPPLAEQLVILQVLMEVVALHTGRPRTFFICLT